MKIHLEKFSFRFAEQVLNSKLQLKEEIESVVTDKSIIISELTRPHFNSELERLFVGKNWESQPTIFSDVKDPSARMDFLKERVGVEVEFGHSSFMGIDLLKFQISSFSALNIIDVGVYIVTTREFQKRMTKKYNLKWNGSLNFEKVVRYLPHFKSAIQVPIYVIGINC